MNSPISALIDANVRCVKCGARTGGCSCWMELRCPKCGKQKSTERLPEDYPEAVRLEVMCPDCNAGDFDEPVYYDAHGNHIVRDPDMPPNATNSPAAKQSGAMKG